MARMVLLEHTLPTGAIHFDWLLERPSPVGAIPLAGDPNDRCLLALRVQARIDEATCTSFSAEAMPDHRVLYLTFEGTLPPDAQGQDRGRVRRVAGGVVRAVREANGLLTIRARWTNGSPSGSRDEWTWAGVLEGDGRWLFQRGGKSFVRLPTGQPDPDENPWGEPAGYVGGL